MQNDAKNLSLYISSTKGNLGSSLLLEIWNCLRYAFCKAVLSKRGMNSQFLKTTSRRAVRDIECAAKGESTNQLLNHVTQYHNQITPLGSVSRETPDRTLIPAVTLRKTVQAPGFAFRSSTTNDTIT